MRSLLRSRRGSVAFATVIALVPLVGVVALGGEAGSWYVTRQHAQNAADAAAYSGAVQQACLMAPPCGVTQTVDYRAKQAAAQNAFCNAGGTSYPGSRCPGSLPAGISQTVTVASLTSWNGASGNFVQAIVRQQQPAYLARVLGMSTVDIPAMAVAKVVGLPNAACVLALTGSISFEGSPNINAPGCGMASNSRAQNALDFTGGGMSMNIGSLSTVGGCAGATSFCKAALTHMPAPVVNPFSALDGALTTLCGANPTLPAKCGLTACSPGNTLWAYTAAKPCTNDGVNIAGNTPISLSGIYFISGTLKITGTPVISGTAIFILLPGATIDNKGNAAITITGPTTAPSAASLPAALQSAASSFQYMALYAAPCASCSASVKSMTFGGNTNITLRGNIYAPTANVTFQGDPTVTVGGGGGGCGQLIAASVAFNGNATFNNSSCGTTKLPTSQYARLWQ